MNHIHEISADVLSRVQKIIESHRRSNDFAGAISNIEQYLEAIKSILDAEERKIIEYNIKIDKKFIIEHFQALLSHLSQLVDQLDQYLVNISKQQFSSYQALTKERLHKFFMLAPFPSRAYNKPLGFAGDYMMMYMIQKLEDDGDSLFSKFINVFYTNIPISNSVKNRTDTLIEYIKQCVKKCEASGKKKAKILSVGCGPALEVRNYLQKNSPEIECEFNLMDFNRETLDFAYNNCAEFLVNKNCRINLIENSVFNIKNYDNFAKVVNGRCDFIYCTGLFDYLSNGLCKKLNNYFYNLLNSNSKLLVTNMANQKTGRILMELILDWHLIYRTKDDMLSLANGMDRSAVFNDITEINLCLEIAKT